MSVTAKSVIFDIATNWGSASFMGARAIEFFLSGSLLSITSGYTCYGTQLSTTNAVATLFNTSLSKTGGAAYNEWLSGVNQITNKRIIVVFDTAITFDSIEINNFHESGGSLTIGIKDTVINISSDIITDTTYNASIPNSTQLYNGAIRMHIASNVADPEILWTEAAETLFLRAICDQLYALIANAYRNIFSQDYSLNQRHQAELVQIYGLRMLVVLSQLYGNSPRFRARLSQYYGDFSLFRRILTQNYGNAARYRQQFDQGWDMPDGLRRIFEQRYSISEAGYRAMLDHVYDISDVELLRAQLDQLYVLAAGEALVQRTDQAVYCGGVEHNSAYNIMIEQDESLFYMVGELQLADETEFLQYRPFVTEVVIEVDGRQYQFVVDADPRRSRQPGENVFVVPLVSKTVLLDSPHSVIDAETLSGMAADLVAVLAAPGTVDWQLVNWFIPPNILQGNGESAISIIKKIVAAAGGIVQTSPAGELVCRPEYPVSVNAWGTATPDLELTDQDDFFQIDPSPDPRPGYNVFFLTNQSLASGGVSMDIIQQSATENELRVSMLPWSETATVRMRHSGGSWVQVIDQGIVIETIEEQVEIIAGSGQTAKPVYAYIDHTYSVVDLGAVEVAEAGNVTTAIAENSLLQLTYQTRYWQFWANDLNIEDVQFYPEIIES